MKLAVGAGGTDWSWARKSTPQEAGRQLATTCTVFPQPTYSDNGPCNGPFQSV